MEKQGLKWLVFGAGAIGTYLGGSLILAHPRVRDQRVLFIERPTAAEKIRQRGLRLRLNGEEHTIPHPEIAESLEQALSLGPFHAAILAIKSYDTDTFLEEIRSYAGVLPPLLCLQNGVDNEPKLEAALGAENVIAGTVTSSIGRRAPGDITLERERGIGIANTHLLSSHIADSLRTAGLKIRMYTRPVEMKWSKLLTNLLVNASVAITNLTPSEILSHPGLFRLEMCQLREALAVMAALGVRPVDLPGTPVRALAFIAKYSPARIAQPLLKRQVGHGRGAKMPSLHIDLHSERSQSEVDVLNGAVVRYGEQMGIPVPVNQVLNQILLALTAGGLDRQVYDHNPQKLLDAAFPTPDNIC